MAFIITIKIHSFKRKHGIGLGLLIWGTANMTIGWMSAHFGILGVAQETVSNPKLNAIGFGCAVASILIYSLVKPMGAEETALRKAAKAAKKKKAGNGVGYSIQSGDISKESLKDVLDSPSEISDGRMTGKMSDAKKRLVGCLLAVVAGCLFGTCFNPAQGVSDRSLSQFCGRIANSSHGSVSVPRAIDDCNYMAINCMSLGNGSVPYNLSTANGTTQTTSQFCRSLADTKGKVYCQWKNLTGNAAVNATSSTAAIGACTGIPDAHMAFSQFCGILLASFSYFCIYNIYMQGFTSVPGEPFVNKKLIGPGFACGMVWAFAQIGWFYANEHLSMQIAFPVITTAPGLIGTIWGIILHDEISLKPLNMFFLALAIAVAGTADALITLSK